MPTMISDYLHLSTARVANALKSLEKKRYIRRSHDMQDRRRVTVSLTPLGKQIAQENLDDTLEKINELMHDMGEEDADEFIRLMKKICRLFDEKSHLCHRSSTINCYGQLDLSAFFVITANTRRYF